MSEWASGDGAQHTRPVWLAEIPAASPPQEGTLEWSQDGALPRRCPSTPSSEAGQCEGRGLLPPAGLGPDNLLLELPVPSAEHVSQGVRLLPSGEPRTREQQQPAHQPPRTAASHRGNQQTRARLVPPSASSVLCAPSSGEPVSSHGVRRPCEWVCGAGPEVGKRARLRDL